MKQKRVARSAVSRPPTTGPGLVDKRETWLQWLAPIVFGIGVGLVLLLSPMTVLAAMGGYGDCFDTACEAERQFWADIGMTQVIGWFAAVALLAVVAHRINHNVWLAVSAMSVIGAAAGVIAAEQGWSTEPELFGVGLPAISPAFYAWTPGAFFMAVGGLMIWLGAGRRKEERTTSGLTEGTT